MITFETAITGNVLKRKSIRSPRRGKSFRKWLAEDQPISPTPKDTFRLRVFFPMSCRVERRLRCLKIT